MEKGAPGPTVGSTGSPEPGLGPPLRVSGLGAREGDLPSRFGSHWTPAFGDLEMRHLSHLPLQ